MLRQIIEKTERFVLWIVAVLLLLSVVLGTVYLVADSARVLFDPPILMIKTDTLFHMFGDFLIILMGVKLIKLVLLTMPGESSTITTVIEVAIIAVGQKVVTMDVKTQSPGTMLGVAALILALSAAYGVSWHVQSKNRKSGEETADLIADV